MSAQEQISQDTQVKSNDKELNFRALQSKYEKQLEQERNARLEAERQLQERSHQSNVDDDDDSEPYVDKKKLNKTLAKFGEQTQQKTQREIQAAVQAAKEEAKQEAWLENNEDFYDVMQHADKLAKRSPALANSILAMPDGFERKKLVYQNIKELGLNKPEEKQPTIQDKINANRKSPYYQPNSVGTAPYQSVGDFSQGGQKQAYEKMQELKSRLRI